MSTVKFGLYETTSVVKNGRRFVFDCAAKMLQPKDLVGKFRYDVYEICDTRSIYRDSVFATTELEAHSKFFVDFKYIV